jgi:hypothetical protein
MLGPERPVVALSAKLVPLRIVDILVRLYFLISVLALTAAHIRLFAAPELRENFAAAFVELRLGKVVGAWHYIREVVEVDRHPNCV